MIKEIEKKKIKSDIKKFENLKFSPTKQGAARSNSKLLISCSNPAFNHYTGQAYKNFSERNFASFGWQNRQSAGQQFTINVLESHSSLVSNSKFQVDSDETIDFSAVNINKTLIELLRLNFDIKTPTIIQYLSINETLLRRKHNVILGETGGGKTLCYALPIIEFAVQLKQSIEKMNLKRNANQPIAVVLVPTRELAFQVYQVFERLQDTSKLTQDPNDLEKTAYINYLNNFNVVIDMHESILNSKEEISQSKLNRIVLDNEAKPIDVLITLPGQLEKRFDAKKDFLNSLFLKNVVLDEADTLLDDSYKKVTKKCLLKLQMNWNLEHFGRLLENFEKEFVQKQTELSENLTSTDPIQLKEILRENKMQSLKGLFDQTLKDPSTQMLFVSATVPHDIKSILNSFLDYNREIQTITSNKINRLMFHVPQKFIRTNGTKRVDLLLELVRKELSKANGKRTIMIFSHRTSTAAFVSKLLKENNIECELLIKSLSNVQRETVVNKFFKGETRILCCTDIASRGWDTLHVNHVINFEMPQFISDYLHRVGRVGRLNHRKHGGSDALVTNFITKRYEVDLVWNIERSVRLGINLDNVDANIKRQLTKPSQV